ncbi:phosphotransferase [Bacteroidota bacterium]
MNSSDRLIKLFEDWSWEKCESISRLPATASNRKYYRLKSKNKTAVGVVNNNKRENYAFTNLTTHFQSKGLPVPNFYSEDLENDVYLIKDLGDTTLFSYMSKIRRGDEFPDELIDLYKRVIEFLPKFQFKGGKDLDYKICFPRSSFDKQSIMWDLNYFKYYFLKLAKIQFDEQALEDDFQTFTEFLLQPDREYFLYRDFQSRNIMIKDNELFFIDYQGGRRGSLHYDIASLLFDAKADIPFDIREELLDYYLSILKDYTTVNKKVFNKYYAGYVLIRIMQAMGAYGYRGFFERKGHFLKSIPFALRNLEWILKHSPLSIKIPELYRIFKELISSEYLKGFEVVKNEKGKLNLLITSFSYKKDLPVDISDNGGGFMFDCRALHNPGRYDEYKQLTGRDKPVIEFLEKEESVKQFLDNAFKLIDQSIQNYLERGFENLMINFGCTGGQHRSVYCAEKLAALLAHKNNLNIIIKHTQLHNFENDN